MLSASIQELGSNLVPEAYYVASSGRNCISHANEVKRIFLEMCAVPTISVFCGFTLECVPGISSKCLLNKRDKLAVAPLIIGIFFAITIPIHLNEHLVLFICVCLS
jgi:hypothetical protein